MLHRNSASWWEEARFRQRGKNSWSGSTTVIYHLKPEAGMSQHWLSHVNGAESEAYPTSIRDIKECWELSNWVYNVRWKEVRWATCSVSSLGLGSALSESFLYRWWAGLTPKCGLSCVANWGYVHPLCISMALQKQVAQWLGAEYLTVGLVARNPVLSS